MYLLCSNCSKWCDTISHISVSYRWLMIDFNENSWAILELFLSQIIGNGWFHYGEYISDTGAPRRHPSFDSHHLEIKLFHGLMINFSKTAVSVMCPFTHTTFSFHCFTVCFVFGKTFLTLLIWNISDTGDLFCITPFWLSDPYLTLKKWILLEFWTGFLIS